MARASDLARQVALARIWSRRLQATSVTAALASRTRRAVRFTSSGSSGASTDYPPPVALKSERNAARRVRAGEAWGVTAGNGQGYVIATLTRTATFPPPRHTRRAPRRRPDVAVPFPGVTSHSPATAEPYPILPARGEVAARRADGGGGPPRATSGQRRSLQHLPFPELDRGKYRQAIFD